jgi:2-keto-4-pentenoate hydratase/2-oxohepta-3-ene-1,7-dioic acid hydratase in catechol pathway
VSNVIGVGAIEDGGRARVVLVVGEKLVFLDESLERAPAGVAELIGDWDRWGATVRDLASDAQAAGRSVDLVGIDWLPPLRPSKILCVGSNYHDHVAEMDGPAGISSRPAPFPFGFLKPASALIGSGRAVRHPDYGRQLDWEAELAVVIGDPAAARGPEPLDAVFGYTILNDLSLRDFIPFPHALGLDAIASKGFDGAAPIGPWITLAECVPDPQALPVELRVNGEVMQHSSTAEMIFNVGQLVRHFSRILSLEPGDVIATGTPAGVAAARKPPRWLAGGDEIEVRIGSLGCLRTTITAARRDDPLLPNSEVDQ